MKRVAIIGGGLMGSGLALVFARAGYAVAITDAQEDTRNTFPSRLRALQASLGGREEALQNVNLHFTLAETVQGSDLVLEAVSEKLQLKQDLFAEVEPLVRPDTVLASNTSVIPITDVMAKVERKERALGMHWWNPPYLVPLVEVIQTADTHPGVILQVMELLQDLGKVPVHVKKDVPGFVGNRMQHALWREAMSLVEQGVCDSETIDLVVKNSFGLRLPVLGPLENADLVGTDLVLEIQRILFPHLENRTTPSPFLERLVRDGKSGFKSNEGFKTWAEDSKALLRSRLTDHLREQNAKNDKG
jgi:3-hydroxybutyryl-CoA dehydrogenase